MRRPTAKSPSPNDGFSLVEVTLALGILAMAIVPVLGLMPVGMRAIKDAGDDAVHTQILQSIQSICRQVESDELPQVLSKKRYFDNEGLMVPGESGAMYTVTVSSSGGLQLPSSANPQKNTHGTTLVVTINQVTRPGLPSTFPLHVAQN